MDQDLRDMTASLTTETIFLRTGPDHVDSRNNWPSLVLAGSLACSGLKCTMSALTIEPPATYQRAYFGIKAP